VLQQRAGGGEAEVRQADARREDPQDRRDRRVVAGGLERRVGQHAGGEPRGEREQRDVDRDLGARRGVAREQVRVDVAAEQHALEEQHRRGPHRRRAAEPRQDRLAGHRLDLEQQERAREDHRGEADRCPAVCGGAAGAGGRGRRGGIDRGHGAGRCGSVRERVGERHGRHLGGRRRPAGAWRPAPSPAPRGV
jgi:hypothetical protein